VRYVVVVLVVALALAVACGGKLAGGDSQLAALDAATDGGADAQDLDVTIDTFQPLPPCSADANYDESGPCQPPPDDILVGTPAVINVPAGTYGVAKFAAEGPWASDPGIYMQYGGTNLPIANQPTLDAYGAVQQIIFLVASDAVKGAGGTIKMSAYLGNITRTAEVTVNITSCAPWSATSVCYGGDSADDGGPPESADGGQVYFACGYEPDNCGGLLACGTCPVQAPYCYLHQCVAKYPDYCPPDYGAGVGGSCIPCSGTRTCTECTTGTCVGVQSVCICQTGG
jgi:hypothetical protein